MIINDSNSDRIIGKSFFQSLMQDTRMKIVMKITLMKMIF